MMIVTMPPVALLALAFVHVRDSNTNLTFYRSKSRIKRFILAMLNWRSSKTDSKLSTPTMVRNGAIVSVDYLKTSII